MKVEVLEAQVLNTEVLKEEVLESDVLKTKVRNAFSLQAEVLETEVPEALVNSLPVTVMLLGSLMPAIGCIFGIDVQRRYNVNLALLITRLGNG